MPAEGEVTHMACVQEASLQFSVLNFFSSEDIRGVSAAEWQQRAWQCLDMERDMVPALQSSQSKCDMDKTIPTHNNWLKHHQHHLSDTRSILTSNWNTKYIYKGYRWDRVVAVFCWCFHVHTGTKGSGALLEKGIFFSLVGWLQLVLPEQKQRKFN